jgi:hypothetical protein
MSTETNPVKLEIIERIRAADFGKDHLTEPIHEMLLSNMDALVGTNVLTTYEAWYGRVWAIHGHNGKYIIKRLNGANAGTLVP